MNTFVCWMNQPLIIPLDQVVDALNPHTWSSRIFLILIMALFLTRAIVRWPAHGAARFAEEVLLIFPAGLFYFLVRNLIDADPSIAFDNAQRVISLQERLGILVEPALQARIIERQLLIDIVNWIYIWAHWPFILGWVLWMWYRHRHTYPLYRNAVLASGAIGMVIFALFPLAPPRFVSEIEVVDTVTLYSRSYRVLQPPSLTNLYAAMPSLHLGWNLLVGIAIARSAMTIPGRALGIALPVGMFAAIVLTGNHYILDGIAGALIALIGLSLSTMAIPQLRTWLRNASIPGTRHDRINTPPGRY